MRGTRYSVNNYWVFYDFDGTICGESNWKGFWHNTIQLFKTGLLLQPFGCWSILTGRPKMDRLIIKAVCKKYRLYPKMIITAPTWTYQFKNLDEVATWKTCVLSKFGLDNGIIQRKVIYIDDDLEMRRRILPLNDLMVCSPKILDSINFGGNANAGSNGTANGDV